ncbi:ATP-binding protein [Salinirarus marinus]|uniref:sensor histidine kinase n=1 Tax=Salinirarus marinus TaxID=3068310 RepID=UPI003C6C5BD4
MDDRTVREARLERLHEATRELMAARTPEDVADVSTETAKDVLGLSVNSVHLWSDDEERLVPVSATREANDIFDELPAFPPSGSVAWEVYTEGNPKMYGDVRDAPSIHNPDTEIRSELVFPLGDHGVFIAGATDAHAFDDAVVSLAKVFAANVETALDRAARENRLRDREAKLERQKDRLDEFTAVVSHDLKNPLSVARGRLRLARDALDRSDVDAARSEIEKVADAHERMVTLLDDLLSLAQQGETVGEVVPVDLETAMRKAWDDTTGGTLVVDGPLGSVEADPQRLEELLANLFDNASRHGGPETRVTVGRFDDGFYVADDGPGIPDEDRDRIFRSGVTSRDAGTGLGLTIVESIAAAHGWEVRVTESEDGGARFEIVTTT